MLTAVVFVAMLLASASGLLSTKREVCVATSGVAVGQDAIPTLSIASTLRLRGGDDSSRVKHVSGIAAFDEEMTAAGNKLVVVDFTGSWCGPCKMIAPVYDEISKEFDDVVFLKVDVDECPGIAERYQVMAMPTLRFLKKSTVADRFSGASIEKLRTTITANK